MANEVSLINGVTKKEWLGIFVYTFSNGVKIEVDPHETNPDLDNITHFDIDKHENRQYFFGEVGDKKGQTNGIDYIEELTRLGYYRDNSNIEGNVNVDTSGLATETTLTAINNKIDTLISNTNDVATETTLEAIRGLVNSLDSKDFATQATLLDVLTELQSIDNKDSATETTLSSILSKLNGVIDVNITGQPITTNANITNTSVPVNYSDSPNLDAFTRLRVSNLTTLIDLKQVGNDASLLYDTVRNGAATSVYNASDSSSTLSVTNNLDFVIRQTYQRFNYESGKSLLCFYTFSTMQVEANVIKRVGSFQTSTVSPFTANIDGVYLESDGVDLSLCIAKNGIIQQFTQQNWNADKLDGTGTSGINLDFARSQIFFTDYDWGVGRVRAGFFIDGSPIYCHYFNHSNNLSSSVFMTSSNQPVRFEIRSTGGSGSIEQISSHISKEGPKNTLGYKRSLTNAIDFQSNVAGLIYGVYALRLKASALNAKIEISKVSISAETGDDLVYRIILNPSYTNPPTFSDFPNSSIQTALGNGGGGAAGTIITGGTILESGVVKGNNLASIELDLPISLGVSINGVIDEIWLTIQPRTGGLDTTSTLTFIEN